jgi:hypothetical protein
MKYREVVFHSVVLSCAIGFFSGLAYGGDISFLNLKDVSKQAVYADESTTAKANIIAITGGNGLNDPIMTPNFLGRAKDDFVKADINYYMFPNNERKEIATPIVRASKERMSRLGNLIKEIQSRNSLPIYVVGFSRGSIEASLASKQYNIDGIVIMSGMFNTFEKKKTPLPASLLTQNLIKETDKRLLIIHHVKDKCRSTPFYKAEQFYNNVKAIDKKMIRLNGGGNTGKICGPLNYHGFEGWETDLTKQVTDWILKK